MSESATSANQAQRDQDGVERATPYAWYALLLLSLANMFNYVDRHIIAALSPAIKADLNLDDADLGFLLGTVFEPLLVIVRRLHFLLEECRVRFVSEHGHVFGAKTNQDSAVLIQELRDLRIV